MQLVTVKCPSCGAAVEVDEYSRSFTCRFCGASTIIEKESRDTFQDKKIANGELFIRNQHNYKSAKEEFSYVSENNPSDPRSWLGLLRCETHDFQRKLFLEVPGYEPEWLEGLESRVKKYYETYIGLDKKKEFVKSITEVYENYMAQNKNDFEILMGRIENKEVIPKETINSNDEDGKFNETIKAENKIIDIKDIRNILDHMNAKLKRYLALYQEEKKFNEEQNYGEREYTFNNTNSSLNFDIDFHDNTEIHISDYNEVNKILDTRLKDVKRLDARLYLSYSIDTPAPSKDSKSYSQYIDLTIREDKLNVDVKLSSEDDKLSDIYSLIKKMVVNAPVKADKIIKKRASIMFLIAFAIGLIPGTIISSMLLLQESIKELLTSNIVVFPIVDFIVSFFLGYLVSEVLIGKKYKAIEPEKKYKGYNTKTHQSEYTDDMESFMNSSEVLIGKNVHNLEYREYIKNLFNTSKKYILFEILAVLIIAVVITFS